MKLLTITVFVVVGLLKEVSADEVCYGDLGCFTNVYPYDNSMFLPQDPATVNTRFGLYTKLNRDQLQVIDRNDPQSLHDSNFDKNKDTKFLTHGWTGSWNNQWVIDMKNEFLDSAEDLNVIAVDWEGGASAIYGRSVSNTQIVGAEIDALVKFLNAQYGEYHHDRVHLIGHSLGAHCSGHAGERMPTIGRITGLDPAGPSFEDRPIEVRLDPSDAKFVDVLHTDCNTGPAGLGIRMESGHADFYPNGGEDQPGCQDGPGGDSCDHSRAYQFYIESINSSCKFTSNGPCTVWDWANCNSCSPLCNYMGYHAQASTPGTFYLETNAAPPFCIA
ncbi:pancreatic lipase-related protein 2-like isoform X2 [Ptychodera flava]